jgi:hypothetical protein
MEVGMLAKASTVPPLSMIKAIAAVTPAPTVTVTSTA